METLRSLGILLVIIFALAYCSRAQAKVLYIMQSPETEITLHDADCVLKKEITNLRKHAEWKEPGKLPVAGCWGYSSQFGLVTLYFADRTAISVPARIFNQVSDS